MLDAQGRIVIPPEQLGEADEIVKERALSIYFNSKKKCLKLSLIPYDYGAGGCMYYIASHAIDKKGRICIPKVIREAFPNATYLPAEQSGEIYIFIIEHEKKSE